MAREDASAPDNPGYWVEQSVALRQDGQLQAAVEACRRALAIAPADARALASLAHTLRWQDRFKDAFDAATKAIHAAPEMAAAWFNCAASLEGLGRPEEAMQHYQRALELQPAYAEAWSNLGGVLSGLRRDAEALEAYRRAAEHNPNLAPIWSNLGNALRHAGRIEEGVAALRRATAMEPDYAPAWANLGSALAEQGAIGDATRALNRSVELDSSLAPAWEALGLLLETQECFADAAAAYSKAAAIGTPSAPLLARLASTLERQGNSQATIDCLRRALTLDPWHVPALAGLSRVLTEAGRHDEAGRCYRTAVQGLLEAAREGDANAALTREREIYEAFVQTTETEEHYRRCFADWRDALARLGAQFRQEIDPAVYRADRIAFVLHAGYVAGHTEVLFKLLEKLKALPESRVQARVFVLLDAGADFLERAARLGVETVLIERLHPAGRAAPIAERFLALRERLREDGFGISVWISAPWWSAFAFSMRLAPVQIFWAMRFHPVSGGDVDGHITWGARDETSRRYGAQDWEVVPLPFALDDVPPPPADVARLRARFPERVLLGTLAREEKIGSESFLRAVTDILAANPQAGFLWTGRRAPPAITARLEAAGVAQRCHFVGWVDTKLHAAALDVFLDSFPQGCGITSYQAFAAGVALLSHAGPYTIFGTHFWRASGGRADGDATAVRLATPDEHAILAARDEAEYVGLAGRLVADAAWRATIGARGRAFYREELANNADYAQRFFATVARIAAAKLGRAAADGREAALAP